MCVVADRGMISAATIAELEKRGIEYILGARERTDKQLRRIVADTTPMVPLLMPRARSQQTTIEVRQAVVDQKPADWQYRSHRPSGMHLAAYAQQLSPVR